MMQLFKCEKVNLRLIEDTCLEHFLFKSIFNVADVRKYYVLHQEHYDNIESFIPFLAAKNKKQIALNYIIELQDATQVGFITADLIRDNSGQIMWNVGYAVHPNYRRCGYAFEALKGIFGMLQRYSIPIMILDICESNTDSIALARKCGFQKMRSVTGENVGFYDSDHKELGMRFRWVKNVHLISKRDKLNQEAMMSYSIKDYQQSIILYEQSLREPYSDGSPFTDGQIHANLGIVYSSVHRYQDAYEALMKAYNMGVQNKSVIKEINWLRNNTRVR